MRILIASKRAPGRPGRRNGGVQTWVLTVAAELRRIGHKVEIGDALIRPSGRFDVGILSNWTHTGSMAGLCDRLLVVSHGIIPDEAPPDGVDTLFCTSEGVAEHWGVASSARILRQPIDLHFWFEYPGIRRSGIVRYSYRAGLEWLPRLAKEIGQPFHHIRKAVHAEARTAMQTAACVLASGRAALEAAACGAPVVICDHRSAYQGPLMAPFCDFQMTQNYSGRGGQPATKAGLRMLIEEAMILGSQRAHVERYHDSAEIVRQLLSPMGYNKL